MDEEIKSTSETPELSVEYANNTFFEPTVWDLKIFFGEFSGRTKSVDWHTSITMPWAQAKLMLFYLALNVEAHELNLGTPINIPTGMLPPEPVPPSGSDDTPVNRAFFEFMKDHRQKFLDSLKSK